MKSFLVALLLTIPVASHAASPERAYLAARDAAIRKVEQSEKRKDSQDVQTKMHDAALADLEKRLRKIVGPLEMKGFVAEGKNNLSALSKGDQGYGVLDGLIHWSPDQKSNVIVSTETLLKVWLKAHRNWWEKSENVPQDVAKALQWDSFYTQAIDTGAAFSNYATLPVSKPAGTLAFAMFGGRAQDIGPYPANLIIVAAVRNGRVFLVSAPAAETIDDMPGCKAVWDESVRKLDELHKQYEAGGRKNEKLHDQQSRKIESDGDTGYRACVGERLKADPRYKTLTEQAQRLLDALPAK